MEVRLTVNHVCYGEKLPPPLPARNNQLRSAQNAPSMCVVCLCLCNHVSHSVYHCVVWCCCESTVGIHSGYTSMYYTSIYDTPASCVISSQRVRIVISSSITYLNRSHSKLPLPSLGALPVRPTALCPQCFANYLSARRGLCCSKIINAPDTHARTYLTH